MIRFPLQPRVVTPAPLGTCFTANATPSASTCFNPPPLQGPLAPNARSIAPLFRPPPAPTPSPTAMTVDLGNLSWMDYVNIAADLFDYAEGDLLFEKIPMNQSRSDICRLPEGVPLNTPASMLERPDDCELFSPPFMSGIAYAQARVMDPNNPRTRTFSNPERPRINNFGIAFYPYFVYRIRRAPAPLDLRVDGLRGVDVTHWERRNPDPHAEPGTNLPRFTVTDGDLEYGRVNMEDAERNPRGLLPLPFGISTPPPPHDHFVMLTDPTSDHPLSSLQREAGITTQRLYVDTYKSDMGIDDVPFSRGFGDLLRSFTQLGDACHRQWLRDHALEYNPNTHRIVTETVTEMVNGTPTTRQRRRVEEIPPGDPNYLPLFDFLGTDLARNRPQIERLLDHEWLLMQQDARVPENQRRPRQASDLPAIAARAFPHGFIHLNRTRDYHFSVGEYHLTLPANMPVALNYRLEPQINPQTGQFDLDRGLEMVFEISRFDTPPSQVCSQASPSDATRVFLRTVQMPIQGGTLQAESLAARRVTIRLPLSTQRIPEAPLVCPAPIQASPPSSPRPMRIDLEGLDLENTQYLQPDGGIGFAIGHGNLEKISFIRNNQGTWHIEWGDPNNLGLQGNNLHVFAPIRNFPSNLGITQVHIPTGVADLSDRQNFIYIASLLWQGASDLLTSDQTPFANASGGSTLSDFTYNSFRTSMGTRHSIDFNYRGDLTARIQDPQAHLGQVGFTTRPFANPEESSYPPISGLVHFVGFRPNANPESFELRDFNVIIRAPSIQLSDLASRSFQPIPFKTFNILPEITDGRLDNAEVGINSQGWYINPLNRELGPAHIALQLERSMAIYVPELSPEEARAHPELAFMYSILRLRRAYVEGFINQGAFEWTERRNARGEIERGVRTTQVSTGPLMVRNLEAQDNSVALHTNIPMWDWIRGDFPCVGAPCPGQAPVSRPPRIPALPDRNMLLQYLVPQESALLANGDFIRTDGIEIRGGDNPNTQICGLMAYVHEVGGLWQYAMLAIPEFVVSPNAPTPPRPIRRGPSSESPFDLSEDSIMELYLRSPRWRLNGESGTHLRGPYRPSANCRPVDARLFSLFRPATPHSPSAPATAPVAPAAVAPTPH